MVICLERGADLHMAQWMPLPLTVSCLSKIQIGFSFLAPAHPGSPGQRAVKRVCVCVCACVRACVYVWFAAKRGRLQQTSIDSYRRPRSVVNAGNVMLTAEGRGSTPRSIYIFYAGGSIAGVSCRRRWPRLLLLS